MTIQKKIHLIGFGSQGTAWAQCLRQSGWEVRIYLSRKSAKTTQDHLGSFARAEALGFHPEFIESLPLHLSNPNETHSETHWIAMLCPDHEIPLVYHEYLAPLKTQLRMILAHGFAMYSGQLQLQTPHHQVFLLAPKAIGPKITEKFQTAFPKPHSLKAAVQGPVTPGLLAHAQENSQETTSEDAAVFQRIASGLGFHSASLIPATFDQETIGDLISEQGVLCGGLFNWIVWTMEAMEDANIPKALIREECISELSLIVDLIQERGLAKTFQAISRAAACGTLLMQKTMNDSHLKEKFQAQIELIKSRQFVEYFHSEDWKREAENLNRSLAQWDQKIAQPVQTAQTVQIVQTVSGKDHR